MTFLEAVSQHIRNLWLAGYSLEEVLLSIYEPFTGNGPITVEEIEAMNTAKEIYFLCNAAMSRPIVLRWVR